MQDMHYNIGDGDGDGRRLRPQQQNERNQVVNCPRCDSTNTKFCYYNNYNLTQPRHFCKNCRRYWTNGGILRNVPVGGGCRKSKRSSSKTKISSDVSSTVDRNYNAGASSGVHQITTETTFSSDPSASELICPDNFSDGWNLNEETDDRKDDWLWPSDMTKSAMDCMNMPEMTAAHIDLTGTVDEVDWSQLSWTYGDTSSQPFNLP